MTQQALAQSAHTPEADANYAAVQERPKVPMAAWGAVVSLALCVAVLIASEFMPVALLSPIANDLGVTEGHAGQAISVSGVFAVLTSLFVASLTRRVDRRLVVTSFSFFLSCRGWSSRLRQTTPS